MLILVDLVQCVLNGNKKILLSDIYNSGESENVTSSVCLFVSAGVLLLARTSCVQLLLHVNQQWRHVEKALMWPPFFVFPIKKHHFENNNNNIANVCSLSQDTALWTLTVQQQHRRL